MVARFAACRSVMWQVGTSVSWTSPSQQRIRTGCTLYPASRRRSPETVESIPPESARWIFWCCVGGGGI